MRRLVALGLCSLAAITGCGRKKRVVVPLPAVVGSVETGIASWYGHPYHGRQSASGEIYDMEALTAAHRTLPFGTWVRVYNLTTDKRVEVRINDRGPFVEGRIIDLSHAAARIIAMIGPGTAPVRMEVIEAPVAVAAAPAAAPSAISPAPAAEPPVAPPAPSSNAGTSDPAPAPSAATAAEPGNAPEAFAVQVGAYRSHTNAERVRSEMEKLYGNSQLVERAGAPPVWRVLVGQEKTMAAANALAERIRTTIEGTQQTAFVVRLDAPPAPASARQDRE